MGILNFNKFLKSFLLVLILLSSAFSYADDKPKKNFFAKIYHQVFSVKSGTENDVKIDVLSGHGTAEEQEQIAKLIEQKAKLAKSQNPDITPNYFTIEDEALAEVGPGRQFVSDIVDKTGGETEHIPISFKEAVFTGWRNKGNVAFAIVRTIVNGVVMSWSAMATVGLPAEAALPLGFGISGMLAAKMSGSFGGLMAGGFQYVNAWMQDFMTDRRLMTKLFHNIRERLAFLKKNYDSKLSEQKQKFTLFALRKAEDISQFTIEILRWWYLEILFTGGLNVSTYVLGISAFGTMAELAGLPFFEGLSLFGEHFIAHMGSTLKAASLAVLSQGFWDIGVAKRRTNAMLKNIKNKKKIQLISDAVTLTISCVSNGLIVASILNSGATDVFKIMGYDWPQFFIYAMAASGGIHYASLYTKEIWTFIKNIPSNLSNLAKKCSILLGKNADGHSH